MKEHAEKNHFTLNVTQLLQHTHRNNYHRVFGPCCDINTYKVFIFFIQSTKNTDLPE